MSYSSGNMDCFLSIQQRQRFASNVSARRAINEIPARISSAGPCEREKMKRMELGKCCLRVRPLLKLYYEGSWDTICSESLLCELVNMEPELLVDEDCDPSDWDALVFTYILLR